MGRRCPSGRANPEQQRYCAHSGSPDDREPRIDRLAGNKGRYAISAKAVRNRPGSHFDCGRNQPRLLDAWRRRNHGDFMAAAGFGRHPLVVHGGKNQFNF